LHAIQILTPPALQEHQNELPLFEMYALF